MSFKKKVFVTLTMLQTFLCLGQSSKPDIMIGAGTSINVLYQQNPNNFKSIQNGYNFGLYTENNLKDNFSVFFGIMFHYRFCNDYENSIYYSSEYVNVNLKTSLSQQFIEAPLIFKYNHKNLSIGAGAIFSYLISSNVSQNAVGYYTNDFLTGIVKHIFELKNYNYTSAFHRTNFAPAINIGYRINNKFNINYLCSYDIISNPVLQFQFNSYNTITNNILLTFKFN